MNLAATIFCTAATLLSVHAITVSVDRADVRPLHAPTQPTHDNYGNGWRPVTTGYDDIGVNVSPSGALDRSLAPLHPVLGKLQEHMAVSERLKPINRNKIPQLEYSPSNLLGTLAFFNQALGGRDERLPGSELKPLSTEREYSFLIPPPRDALRFDVDPHKKSPYREEEPYVRSSQFIPQAIKPDSRSPTYFIKPATFTTNPYNPGRPFINNYNVQQSFIPPRQPPKQFDSLKTSNEKPYFQPSNDNSKVNAEQNYERYQSQRVVNGQYYNQINHPQAYKQATFLPERDQTFLVHESHEVSNGFGTPSSSYKFRPFHYENAQQETFPSSTPAPRLEQNKFIPQHQQQQSQQQSQQQQQQQQQRQQINNIRPDGFKQFSQSTKEPEKNEFFFTDFQKTRYQTPDINEVLPKTNSPAKFNQVSTTPIPSYVPDHSPKVVYVRPEIQQQQQYQSSIIPLNINQRPPEVEYDTPESISLKHFNEQQFLLQQQLIQQDRQRLREQEKRRQQELQRQQQEEINKRQQEIKLLEQKHKEKQRLEQFQTPNPDIVKEIPQRPVQQVHQFLQPARYPVIEQKPVLQEPYKHVYHQVSTESPQHVITVQKFEEVVTPAGTPATTQEEFQPVARPYRPQKPSREQIRRRKPTTVIYDAPATDPPTPAYAEISEEALTDVPIQTTSAPETTTVTATERIVRTRRPGAPLRRRRPSTTTTTQEPNVSSQDFEEDVVKYKSPEVQDFEKKKRVRPASYNQDSAERRPLYSRKRPGQRVKGYKERNEYESIPERVKTTEQTLKESSDTENYPAPFLKEYYSGEYIPTSEKALTVDTPQEVSTESLPIQFYYETTLAPISIYQEPTQVYHQEQYTPESETNGALDHYFTKTEVNYVDATTTPPPTTTTPTTTTTTTTEAPTSSRATVVSTPKPTHRMRPVRYGNATRPRFSIKDYKSRVDYKNRLSQSSSTEASTVTASPKVRGHKNQQNPADPNFKEASIRYKHMSRTPYRSTTTTASPSSTLDETSHTTERSTGSRFTPKKRITTSHYYRSRVTTSTPSSKRDQEHQSVIHSTSRPENVFSSSIRKRPTLKSKLSLAERNRVTTDAEMQSAAETGSFATTTLATVSEAANEVDEPTREVAVEEATKRPEEVTSAPPETPQLDLSDVTMEENEEERSEAQSERTTEGQTTVAASPVDSTTPFDLRHEEELFAKASQSVADLTSSASALYDKPGMFKAVSPASENRAISAHLKITTDEPTLPIEAFFQEISRKN